MGLGAAKGVAVEAARLAKADLATSTVMEMTALAGTMGRWAGWLGRWLGVQLRG
jgi:glycyl-tRNA synthetase beta subunit